MHLAASENHGIQKAVVTINDKSVDLYSIGKGQPDWLALSAPEKFPKGKATLRLEFTGVMNHKLVGMYRVKHDKHWYVYTQFEPPMRARHFLASMSPASKPHMK